MKSREQLERIVQKILAEAEHAEMPLSSLLASNQPIAWHIISDPHWSASLISMTRGPSSHRAKDRAGAATKHRFELLVEGKLVLRATLQKTLIWIDSCSTGPWQTWFAA